ncbi:unnamed protein product [Nezara viridula]|uniref:Neuropeptide n=1 Tax=Nezara viridula TaxID=85310 RepID=A0A9P0EHE1_NEZVI|nr:unnamed protein product [Nezara viridula]
MGHLFALGLMSLPNVGAMDSSQRVFHCSKFSHDYYHQNTKSDPILCQRNRLHKLLFFACNAPLAEQNVILAGSLI